MKNEINGIKLLKKGVRGKDGKYHPCYFNKGGRYINGDGETKNAITIYARDYIHLPKELNPQNDSDLMTDYFEQDRAVFWEGSEEYAILEAFMTAPAKPKKPKAEKPAEPVEILNYSSHKNEAYNFSTESFELSCGKTKACVSFFIKNGNEINSLTVLCKNASNRVWRGIGKTYWKLDYALQSYRSDAMRKIIMAAAGAVNQQLQQAA